MPTTVSVLRMVQLLSNRLPLWRPTRTPFECSLWNKIHTQTHTKTKTVGNTVNTSLSMSSAHSDHLNWKLKGGLRKPWDMDIDSGKSKKGWHQIIKKRHSLVKLKYLAYNVFLNNPSRQLTKVYFWSSPCFHDKVTSTPNRQINKCVKTLK